jgi:hypothetical protein
VSSGSLVFPVRPGGCLVVEGAGFEAPVLRHPWRMPTRRLATLRRAALCPVPRARSASYTARAPGEAVRAAKACELSASTSRSLCTNRAATVFLLPDARVMGLVVA